MNPTWADYKAAEAARVDLGTRYNVARKRADATGDYTEERSLLAEMEREDAKLDEIFRELIR